MKKLILIIVLISTGLAGLGWWSIQQPVRLGTEQIDVEIPGGTSVAGAVEILVAHALLSWPSAAKLYALVYARLSGEFVHRGRFTISRSQSQMEAVRLLFQRGDAHTFNITFPEGLSIWRTASIVQAHSLCDSAEFVRLATSSEFTRSLGIEAESLEGYLMPDTYNFYRNSSVKEVIGRMVREHRGFWSTEHENLAAQQGYNHREILTLASIIQAETPLDWEKKRVSGVYHNRLDRGMRLQADPTVQYALGDQQRRLLYRDLEIDNPYNTYMYAGLPPGPINSPGRAAIEAALSPEVHSYLFFVAAGDGTNSHVFSKNAREHERAVLQYRKRRRNSDG